MINGINTDVEKLWLHHCVAFFYVLAVCFTYQVKLNPYSEKSPPHLPLSKQPESYLFRLIHDWGSEMWSGLLINTVCWHRTLSDGTAKQFKDSIFSMMQLTELMDSWRGRKRGPADGFKAHMHVARRALTAQRSWFALWDGYVLLQDREFGYPAVCNVQGFVNF